MKDKDKRFGVPKIDRLFVPVPHELVLDHRVSSSAQRLWEGLHICAWHKFPPDPDRLAELMHTTRRSVFRWLAELEEYRWMERFRSLDSEERYLLKTSVDEAQDSLTLAKIRAALDSGATLDDIRALLDASDKIVASDKNGTGDKHGTRSDITITASDKRITSGDRNGTLDAHLQPPKAVKRATQNHENHEKSHETPPARTRRNGVGGAHDSVTATELYLIESDINPSVARELGDLPLDRVRPVVEQKKAAGSRPGGIVNALRVLRSKLSQPAPSDAFEREAAGTRAYELLARVEAIAPPDASDLDKQYLMLYLDEEGLTEAEALNKLRARHA